MRHLAMAVGLTTHLLGPDRPAAESGSATSGIEGISPTRLRREARRPWRFRWRRRPRGDDAGRP
ncbi:hypothetical protein [Streptosporangium sp. NPDC000396]|uniref:hypothetical protein n=1 Tax=Streptosporangium sp. NPDC000396 TaxID=3366185 RepID=UPI0036899965